MPDALLVATAGHVDHGKTALVAALTGTETDRLPEERARGITIALGHAVADLAGRRIAFVDVPGHERLVRTMVAGAHGVDAALLVVASDEGVMPQTREHAAILGVLGVTDVVVALTKVDLADRELLPLVEEEVVDLCEGLGLVVRAVVPCSGRTGEGVEAVGTAIAAVERRAPPSDGPFRLPVDRVFTQSGFGTVVTGTARGAPVREGARVVVQPAGHAARVRGVQVHGEAVGEAHAGQRAALVLSGVATDDVGRGDVVCGGPVPVAEVIDLWVRGVAPEVPWTQGMPLRVLVGTAEVGGRGFWIGEDAWPEGGEGPIQVRLDAPVVALPGDRVVVRRPSPAATLGGGTVLDPWATPLRRREGTAWRDGSRRLAEGDAEVWRERAGSAGVPVDDPRAAGGVVLGDRALARGVVARLSGTLVEALADHHGAEPLSLGAPRRALVRGPLTALTEAAFDALLQRLAASGALVVEGPRVRAAHFRVTPSDGHRACAARVMARLADAGPVGLPLATLVAEDPDDDAEAVVRWMLREGEVVDVADLGLVGADVPARVRAWIAAHFAAGGEALTPAALRDGLDLTRKTALPWLAHADAQGWTTRVEAGRVAGPSLGGGSRPR